MYKRKVPNSHKIVIDFSSSNAGSTLAKSSFRSIGFANNKDDQENSTIRTIYKSSDQTPETGTNIKCKLVKKGP